MAIIDEVLAKDDQYLNKNAFAVIVEKEFADIQTVMSYMLAEERTSVSGQRQSEPVVPPTIQALLGDTSEPDGYMSLRMRTRQYRDSSLGGSEVLNPLPQFSIDDDIIYPLNALDLVGPNGAVNPDPQKGIGRVHDEMFISHQQVLYISYGVPEFSNPIDFFQDHIDAALARIMNTGEISEGGIGRLLGYGVGAIIALPFMPIKFVLDTIENLSNTKISKYYDFKSTMHLYYRTVNTMLIHVATNLGRAKGIINLGEVGASSSDVTGGISVPSLIDGNGTAIETNQSPSGVSRTFGVYGYDIYRIISKRHEYQTGKLPSNLSTDNWIDKLTNKVTSAGEWFITSADMTTLEANLFVGYRIEKSTDSQESLSNSTTESKLASIVNSKVQEGRERAFMMGDKSGGVLQNIVSAFGGSVSGLVAGAGDMVGLNVGEAVNQSMLGNAVTDIPKIYAGSSFSKSYSFNMKLRAYKGDTDSILQRLYIPAFSVMAGAFPRATGKNSYTSPYYCRFYSRGMIACPLGMVSDLTITRGSDQFGWNNRHLPLALNLSFSIEDLSPAMYIAIAADGTSGIEIFGQNSTYQEYLLTLSGMGLQERLLFSKNFKRRINTILNLVSSEFFNPYYLGAEVGSSLPGQLFAALRPASGLSNL